IARGADPQCFEYLMRIVVDGKHDNFDIGILFFDKTYALNARHTGKLNIHQDNVGSRMLFQILQHLLDRINGHWTAELILHIQITLDEIANLFIVFNNSGYSGHKYLIEWIYCQVVPFRSLPV